MHSSRMRTARSLPYGGASLFGGSLSGRPPDRDPLPVNRMTDASKNITLPKLRLRVVKTFLKDHVKVLVFLK